MPDVTKIGSTASVSPPKMDGYIRELIVASEHKAYKRYGYATVV